MSQSQALDVKAHSSELALLRAVNVVMDALFLERVLQFFSLSSLQTSFSCHL